MRHRSWRFPWQRVSPAFLNFEVKLVTTTAPKVCCLGLLWKCEGLFQEQLESQGNSKAAVAQRRAQFVRALESCADFNDITLKAFQALEEPFKDRLKRYIEEKLPSEDGRTAPAQPSKGKE